MGAAGDMLAGALADVAGVNEIDVKIPGVELSIERLTKCGIAASRLVVKVHGEEEGEQMATKNLTIANILLLSIATSIDAFAVGISFAFIKANMVLATSAIALASFVMGVIGYEIGRHAAKKFKTKIPEIIAGIILIGIGVKMFF